MCYTLRMSELTSPISIAWKVTTKQGQHYETRTADSPYQMMEILAVENQWGTYTPEQMMSRLYYKATGQEADDSITAGTVLEKLSEANIITILEQ